jgi:hypothetical protein
MNSSIALPKRFLIFGTPFLLIALVIVIAKSAAFNSYPNKLAIGITLDLVLTIPLFYFLLIRKTSIPKITVVPCLIIGLVICSLMLPSENQFYLNLFKKWALPVIELSVFFYVCYNVIKAVKNYKANKDTSFDFFTTLKKTCSQILPTIAVTPVATEIAVIYYGFIYWKKIKLKENEFSYHKNSGTISLLIAIIFIIGIETLVLHILIAKWSTTAAWILSCLSIYSGIQLFGFLKSIMKRPIIVEKDQLLLHYGIMNESIIDLNKIDSIELFTKDIELDKTTRKLSFLGNLEGHNILIKLKEEQTLVGIYGRKKKFKVLALYVDDKIEFINKIKNAKKTDIK